MASLSFPVTGLQPVAHDQPAPSPAQTGGPRAVDPNQQDAPQGDKVTLSATFPPTQAVQQSATVTIEQFSLFISQTDVQTGQAAAPAPPTTAPGAPPAPQVTAQAAASTGAPAVAAPADPGTASAIGTPNQGGTAANPQQELAQLDQTLQQLGIDPQSISLFNRIGLLLYANDPTALENLVQALKTVDQQISQLGGATNSPTSTTQPQSAAQALLANINQAQSQAQQGTAQITPEPFTPLQGSTPAQAPSTPLAQLEGQSQNAAGGNVGAAVFEAQLSFSEVQGTIQGQSTSSQQGGTTNQSSANNSTSASSAQTNNLLVNFQELQLTFQAIEIQAPQPQTPSGGNSKIKPENQGLNVNA
jgi:hypothetical protein